MRELLLAPARRRADLLVAAALALVPLALGVGWWTAHPTACLLGEDAVLWALAAEGFSEGSPLRALQLQRAPLYPALVGGMGALGVEIPAAATGVSLIAAAAWPALLYLVAGRRFGRLAGLLAVLGAGFHLSVLVRAPFTGADLLFLPLFLLAVLAIARIRRPGDAALAGGAVVLCALCKPQGVLLLPLLGGIGWRRGQLLASVLPPALLLMPWLALEATAGRSPIGMAAGDALLGLGLGRTLVDSLLRMGAMLLRWSPLLVWVPVALHLDRRQDGERRVLLLAGASMLLALPVLWQPRHLLGFLAVLVLVGSAAAPALLRRSGRRAGLALLPVLAAVALGGQGLVRAPAEWSEAMVASCTPSAAQAGRWLREEARVLPGRDRLAQVDPALEFYAGLPGAGALGADRAFFEGAGRAPAPPGERLWLVVAPDLGDRRTHHGEPRHLAEGTTEVYASGDLRILMRELEPVTPRRPPHTPSP